MLTFRVAVWPYKFDIFWNYLPEVKFLAVLLMLKKIRPALEKSEQNLHDFKMMKIYSVAITNI